ncbi:murein DD-endopeptidase MepM/ murein hydrolase activator NlpD [Polynucleobacter sphagniphilus]|jgi:murein DD-endopeptidase MepM/ murein hydrolase activator NlpD|uniref:Murein DD-endopeptidase MepM/ murein hydrolase activator NlpD n=1 Tax=Polynucleobacter sphagniphilus TaxID=1743169 RepID=A0AA43M9U8_9BURK|nr:M23 family metallopeptidase [Polynucleobacter sphagniphilus]MDF9787567.1 murein DD-endopeptidase MepM/ murein hydrolase activator NlpD [Polynucleobacter sphagniphilus]MDH6300806.1 murein DD-endopeptidase MepM/ murein hydrolase activator NlpD [Polynucleobacter sphagniphilus]MDH6303056.1 murein DD-endopeptidase MepM/ murein hydrolase activator NlpD [Polynucleobacter sphagniphilus]MDH6504831.1 murein DD-endopeptidase MepM/ murein hydrolase activator NlpD [Polynucleobacter sphagniphilus]MDH6513
MPSKKLRLAPLFVTSLLLGSALSSAQTISASTPTISPVVTKPLDQKLIISSAFGTRVSAFSGEHEQHEGLDIPAQAGSPILATGNGKVTYAGYAPGYGNLVEIDHGQGYATRYGHAQTLLVKTGDTVKQSQIIATVGSTGRSTGPHLHFEVSFNKVPFDPKILLGGAFIDNKTSNRSVITFTTTKLKAPWQLQQLAQGKYPSQILYTSTGKHSSGEPFVLVRSRTSTPADNR